MCGYKFSYSLWKIYEQKSHIINFLLIVYIQPFTKKLFPNLKHTV